MSELDDATPTEKLAFLRELIDELLSSYNYPPVDVLSADLEWDDGGDFGQYDPDVPSITFDEEHLDTDDMLTLMSTALHETFHHIDEIDYGGDVPDDVSPIHDDEEWANDYNVAADDWVAAAYAHCEKRGQSLESPPGELPELNWGLANVDQGEDDE